MSDTGWWAVVAATHSDPNGDALAVPADLEQGPAPYRPTIMPHLSGVRASANAGSRGHQNGTGSVWHVILYVKRIMDMTLRSA